MPNQTQFPSRDAANKIRLKRFSFEDAINSADVFCQQRVDLVCLYSDGHRASEYKPLYGFTYPAAPHTLCLLDIIDVILTEVAHLFS